MTANTATAAHDLVLILWSLIVGLVAGVAFGVALARSLRPKRRPTPLPAPTAVLPRVETPTVQFVPVSVIHTMTERRQPPVYHYGSASHPTYRGATK